MGLYRKIIRKRISVLKDEIKKYDEDFSTKSTSIETILRGSAEDIEKQADRMTRYNEINNELFMLMGKKEMLEQRLNELEIIQALVKEIDKERK